MGSRIFCPFHLDEEDREVEAEHVATFDDDDFNSIGTVELNRFRCTENPDHQWEHPSKNFWLRFAAWGTDWKGRRDRYRGSS